MSQSDSAPASRSLLREYQKQAPEERAGTPAHSLLEAFEAEMQRSPLDLISLLRECPAAIQTLPAERVAEAWRHLADLNSVQSMKALALLPEPVLAKLPPEGVARRWEARAAVHGHSALGVLRYLPDVVRACVAPAAIRTAWEQSVGENPGVAAETVRELPDAQALLGAEARNQALRAFGAGKGEVAMDSALHRVRFGMSTLEQVELDVLWDGFASASPREALEWMRRQSAVVRAHLPPARVHQAWDALAHRDGYQALEWLQRMPKKWHPELTEERLTVLLRSPDARTRLRAIALFPRLGKESLPKLPRKSPR